MIASRRGLGAGGSPALPGYRRRRGSQRKQQRPRHASRRPRGRDPRQHRRRSRHDPWRRGDPRGQPRRQRYRFGDELRRLCPTRPCRTADARRRGAPRLRQRDGQSDVGVGLRLHAERARRRRLSVRRGWGRPGGPFRQRRGDRPRSRRPDRLRRRRLARHAERDRGRVRQPVRRQPDRLGRQRHLAVRGSWRDRISGLDGDDVREGFTGADLLDGGLAPTPRATPAPAAGATMRCRAERGPTGCSATAPTTR